MAIHDDIVDEDLDKFGAAPLPVRLSGQGVRNLTQHGKDLALYYGDFLIGIIFRLAANTATRAPAITRLIGDTLYVTQRGQLAELLTEERQLCDTSVEDVLLIGERKSAYYCYAFPFALGATLAGHPPDVIDPVVSVLATIGTLSQVVDDLTGAFPGVIDNDKDTLGEIANLRRTLPLARRATRRRSSSSLTTPHKPRSSSCCPALRPSMMTTPSGYENTSGRVTYPGLH